MTAASEREAQAALRATPTDELLRSAYLLTHRMDDAARLQNTTDPGADLRAQRDLIDAELERRTRRVERDARPRGPYAVEHDRAVMATTIAVAITPASRRRLRDQPDLQHIRFSPRLARQLLDLVEPSWRDNA